MRVIAKSYKRYVQSRILSCSGPAVSRPFLLLQIRCPPESYDANIEPAKDEVMFHRPDQLLSLMECLLSRAYPIPDKEDGEEVDNSSVENMPTISSGLHRVDMKDVDGEVEVQDNAHEAAGSEEMAVRNASSTNPFIIAAMTAKIKPKKMDTNQVSTSPETSTNSEVEEAFETTQPSTTRYHEPSLGQASGLLDQGNPDLSPPLSPRPGPPMRRRVKASTHTDDEGAASHTSQGNMHKAFGQQTGLQTWLTPDTALRHLHDSRDGRPRASAASHPREGTTDSDTIFTSHKGIPSSSQMGQRWGAGQKPFKVPSKRRGPRHSYGGLPPTPPSSVRGSQGRFLQRDLSGLPIEPELADDGDVSLDSLQQLPPSDGRETLKSLPSSELPEPNSELNEIMDFEHRKKAAIAHQRKLAARFPPTPLKDVVSGSRQSVLPAASDLDSQETMPREGLMIEDYDAKFGDSDGSNLKLSSSNPHRNRYLKALKTLSHAHPRSEDERSAESDGSSSHGHPTADLDKPELPFSDPRAYLMRQQQKPSNGRLHRTKSSKLPLEGIPLGLGTFDLALETNLFENVALVQQQVRSLTSNDSYIMHGKIEPTNIHSTDVPTTEEWETILRKMITMNYRTKAEDGKELVPDLEIEIVKSF